jgi:hypothetical protein
MRPVAAVNYHRTHGGSTALPNGVRLPHPHLNLKGDPMRIDPIVSRSGRRPVIFTAVGALVAGLLAAASGPEGGGPALGADALVSGVITRDAQPVAGADVLVMTEQSDEAQVDDRAELLVAAHVTSDTQGRFAVSLNPADISPEHINPDGWVTVFLRIADATSQVTWVFTAIPGPGAGAGSVWLNGLDADEATTRLVVPPGITSV